jgi:hypothetical protein
MFRRAKPCFDSEVAAILRKLAEEYELAATHFGMTTAQPPPNGPLDDRAAYHIPALPIQSISRPE